MKIPALLSRMWRAVKPAPVATVADAAKLPPGLAEDAIVGWTQTLLGRLGTEDVPAPRKLKMPDILPGVRPKTLPATIPEAEAAGVTLAMDGGHQEMLAQDNGPPEAWGFGGTGWAGPGLTFLGFPYLAELAQISEYRVPAESLSTEMTRTWMTLKNKGKRDLTQKIKELTDAVELFKIRDLFRKAALKTEQFGRAHIYVSVQGQDDDRNRQLPLKEIKKGDLIGFSCIEPYWLTPYSWNSTHPERPDFYRPQSWFVLGRKTHHTRLLTFIFREVPDLLKPAYDFSGISITQLMMPYVTRWLRTAKNVNDLINIFSIVSLSTDLSSLLQAPVDSPKGLLARMKAFTQSRDNRGVMLVNKTTEEVKMNNVPLSGLEKLQAQAQEHMATPARMPLIKFFGIVPSGLNAGKAEGEFQCWYDYCHALQELGFTPHMIQVLVFLQMHLWGAVEPDITHEWLPLFEPTGKELAEIRTADAKRDETYVNMGAVDADEVRDKLQKDPNSGYNGLEGPAPGPPQDPDMEPGAELDEQAAQNQHARSEESAEAAHKRALEVAKNKPQPGTGSK